MSDPNALILTTVPSGFDTDGETLVVTVHVSPQPADPSTGAGLSNWTTDVMNGTVSFQLDFRAIQTEAPIAIKPTAGLLKSGLWGTLFGDLPLTAKAQLAASSKSRPEVNNMQVHLRHVLQNAQDFYGSYVQKFDLSAQTDIATLATVSKSFADQHSIYAYPGTTSNVTPARAYLSDPETAPGKNITVTRIFGNIDVNAAFPAPKPGALQPYVAEARAAGPVNLQAAVTSELDNINNDKPTIGTERGGNKQHVIHHINRLRSVSRKSPANIVSSSLAQNVSQPVVMNFSQRITLLQNMPALLEGLGLILEFKVPQPFNVKKMQQVRVTLVPPSYNGFTAYSPWTYVDPSTFLPLPAPPLVPPAFNRARNPKIAANGYIDVSGKDEYFVDYLQPESASSHMYNFANQTALRLTSGLRAEQAVTRQIDEDYTHPLLPHSPHTAGLYVYQHGRQSKVQKKLKNAPIDWNNASLYAEDLFHSYAVDVLPEGESWVTLTIRDERYVDLSSGQEILSSPNREHGVRTSTTRPTDTVSAPNNGTKAQAVIAAKHVVDETLFTWRKGSLALHPSRGGLLRQNRNEHLSNQVIPWDGKLKGEYSLPKGIVIPDQRFGVAYDFALRPIYLTGRARPQDSLAARTAIVPRESMFVRNELVLGPQIVRKNGHGLTSETRNLMYVASRIHNPQNDDLPANPTYSASTFVDGSIRYLVPAAATRDVAERHGKAVTVGANTIPLLEHAAIPATLPLDDSEKKSHHRSEEDKEIYIPDPMCDGVRADLYFIGNTRMYAVASCYLKYYPEGHDWPQYVLHCVELKAGKGGTLPTLKVVDSDFPFRLKNPYTSEATKILRCTLPPGMTAVLELIPTIVDSERGVHAFSVDGMKAKLNQAKSLEDTYVCRPTILRMTHATDIPLIVPNVALHGDPFPVDQTPRTFDRKANPSPTISIDYEPYTTSKIAIEASWDDQVDKLPNTSPNTSLPGKQHRRAAFYHSHLPKVLVSTDLNKLIALGATEPTTAATIPFSDKCYRRVTLTTSSISRYANIFDKVGKMPLRSCVYDFLATDLPPVPDVEYLIPTYEWSYGKNSNTRTSGLAVMLNRPWYASGDGEQLAVILPPKSPGTHPPEIPSWYPDGPNTSANVGIENQVTAWGTHAIWDSAENGTHHIDLVCPDGSGPITLDDGTVFGAFDPVFDQGEGRWCCNLSFSSPPVYGVLMRLALARYQPNTISSIRPISDVVLTDFAFLRPSRMVMVKKKSFDTVEVTVSGIGIPDKTKQVIDVRVAVEYDEDHTIFNYYESDSATPIDPPPNGALWHGFVKLHGASSTLVVREYERYVVFEGPPDASGLQLKTSKRLVYATAVDIGRL